MVFLMTIKWYISINADHNCSFYCQYKKINWLTLTFDREITLKNRKKVPSSSQNNNFDVIRRYTTTMYVILLISMLIYVYFMYEMMEISKISFCSEVSNFISNYNYINKYIYVYNSDIYEYKITYFAIIIFSSIIWVDWYSFES